MAKKVSRKLARDLTKLFGERRGLRVVDEFPEGAKPGPTDVIVIGDEVICAQKGHLKCHYMMHMLGELGDGKEKTGDGFELVLRPASREMEDLLELVYRCSGLGIGLPPLLRTAPLDDGFRRVIEIGPSVGGKRKIEIYGDPRSVS